MKLGQTFKAFAEFEEYRLQWQRDTYQNYIILTSDMLKKGDPTRDTLVYKSARLKVNHGKERNQESTGARPQQRTIKLGCQASFSVSGSKKAGTLTVKGKLNISDRTSYWAPNGTA